MRNRPRRVAVACCRESGDAAADVLYPDVDRARLGAALARLSVAVVFVAWDDETCDWASFDRVVIRSTWDSVDRPEEYRRWAQHVDRVTELANPVAAVEWNLDKHYLHDLAGRGIAVPRTDFVRPGQAWTPPAGPFVVKPAISGGGRETALHGREQLAEATSHIARLHGRGATAMVQEHLPAIAVHGEVKQIFIGGEASHAIRTDALLTLGAGVLDRPWEVPTNPVPTTPSQAEAELAAAALEASRDAVGVELLYARVDSTLDARGDPVVLEVELIDPALSLWASTDAATRLAEAIAG